MHHLLPIWFLNFNLSFCHTVIHCCCWSYWTTTRFLRWNTISAIDEIRKKFCEVVILPDIMLVVMTIMMVKVPMLNGTVDVWRNRDWIGDSVERVTLFVWSSCWRLSGRLSPRQQCSTSVAQYHSPLWRLNSSNAPNMIPMITSPWTRIGNMNIIFPVVIFRSSEIVS